MLCSAGATLLVLLSSAAVPGLARASQSPELRCRHGIETAYRRWLNSTLKAREKCQADILRGLATPETDCVAGTEGSRLADRLDRAGLQLRQRVAASCTEVHWGLLSFPGPCGQALEFGGEALASCMEDFAARKTVDFFNEWYPAELGYERGARRHCLRLVPRRAAAMVVGELSARLACLLDQESGRLDGNVDCRAQPAPYGPGTGDAAVDRVVERSHRSWLSGFPRPCTVLKYEELGYGAGCSDPAVSVSDRFGFRACVYRDNRRAVSALMEFAFPSSAVCGNGILQEGEVCDDGTANSDSQPDACRLDCTLPRCGDHVTDPGNGETCDDGNTGDLDGCDAACQREFCGDGIVNDLPHEVCDDGNTDPHDLCTDTCQVARCGDGVVCSDPACTSGPGGGPEICDRGTANGDEAICKTDCSGFSFACTLKVGVTNTTAAKLGALTYEMSYRRADGEFPGTGGSVQCTSPVAGGLVSFFDNESARTVKESLIVSSGVRTPTTVAECNYVTNDAGLAASDFTFTVQAASDTSFHDLTVDLAVTELVCTP